VRAKAREPLGQDSESVSSFLPASAGWPDRGPAELLGEPFMARTTERNVPRTHLPRAGPLRTRDAVERTRTGLSVRQLMAHGSRVARSGGREEAVAEERVRCRAAQAPDRQDHAAAAQGRELGLPEGDTSTLENTG
jgi:hypothetical protein